MKIIGISGKAQHGKDTLAAAINGLLFISYRLSRRAFADSLKEDAFDILVHDMRRAGAFDRVWLEEGKEGPIAPIDFINRMKSHPVYGPTMRTFLQVYGATQREAQPDYWIKRLQAWAAMHEEAMGGLCARPNTPLRFNGLIIPDVRYQNEANWIRAQGGLVVRVTRRNEDGSYFQNSLSHEARAHPSETDLDAYPDFDAYVENVSGFKIDVPVNVVDYACGS